MAAGVMSPTRTFYITLNTPGPDSTVTLQKLFNEGKIPESIHYSNSDVNGNFIIKNHLSDENIIIIETNDIPLDLDIEKTNRVLNSVINKIILNAKWITSLGIRTSALYDWNNGFEKSEPLIKLISEASTGDGQTGGRRKLKSKRKSSRKTRKYSKKSSKSKNKKRKH